MKTPLTYYGGKQKMAKTIIEMMPKQKKRIYYSKNQEAMEK